MDEVAATAQTVNLSIAFDLKLDLADAAVKELLDNLEGARIMPDEYPLGFANALSKLGEGADSLEVLRVLVGEIVGEIVSNEIPHFFPPVEHGFNPTIKNVVYLETPPRLAPPEDVVPVVVKLGDRTTQ